MAGGVRPRHSHALRQLALLASPYCKINERRGRESKLKRRTESSAHGLFLLSLSTNAASKEPLAQCCYGVVAGKDMDGDEPGAEDVDKVVEEVSVCNAVNGRVAGEDEEEDVGYVWNPGSSVSGRCMPHTARRRKM